MAEASLSAQRLAVVAMRGRAALTDLCPATNIFDKHSRPEVFPCIIIGEGGVDDESATCIVAAEVTLVLHVYTKENDFTTCKNISGEVQRALRNLSGTFDGFACDFDFDGAVYMRDPTGQHSHAVLTFTVLAEDLVGI